MTNVAKKLPENEGFEPISVYSFAGSVIIPTEQGSYWANAVGGEVLSRPTGNPFVLFSLKYLWGLSGEVSEFPEPIKIRLNTTMAVTEKTDFRFPAPEVPVEEPAAPSLEGDEDEVVEEGDEDLEGDEFDDEDEIDEDVEEGDDIEADLLAEASRNSEDEISW